jgi:hypothetical protein
MSNLAANPATLLYLETRSRVLANWSMRSRNEGVESRASWIVDAKSDEAAVRSNSCNRGADETFGPVRVCRYVSRPLLGHSFGAFPAPGGTRSSASATPPLRGHGSSQKKFEKRGNERHSNFSRAPPRKQTFGTWEPGPLARLRPV